MMNIKWEFVFNFFNSNFFNIIVAIFGWWIVSRLRDKQAVKERQREISARYLLEAHRVLSSWVWNKKLTNENKAQIENIIDDIYLLGSNNVISALDNFLESYKQNHCADPTNLLNTLVSDLRSELKMEPIISKRKFLRF